MNVYSDLGFENSLLGSDTLGKGNVDINQAKGADCLATHHKTEHSFRRWCTSCGGHVLTEHPGMGLTDVYAAVIEGLRFEPQLHVHYGESVLRVADGLPKQKDMPAEMGGSGVILPE